MVLEDHMKKCIWLVSVATLLVSACGDAFTEENAPFIGYNVSNFSVAVIVNGGEEVLIPANRSTAFGVRILVPQRRVYSTVGPSSLDKRVQVSVAFRNVVTNKLLAPILCDAGAKVVTTVWYTVDKSGRESVRCQASYPQY